MNHEQASGRLSAYVDGEVTGEERAGMARHIGECEVCAKGVREYEAISRMVREMPVARMEAGMLRRIQGRVEQVCQRPVERFVGLLSGVAACLAMMGGLLMLQPANAPAASAPASWEGQAVGILDEASQPSANATREAAIGQWMVSNLSVNEGSGHD